MVQYITMLKAVQNWNWLKQANPGMLTSSCTAAEMVELLYLEYLTILAVFLYMHTEISFYLLVVDQLGPVVLGTLITPTCQALQRSLDKAA